MANWFGGFAGQIDILNANIRRITRLRSIISNIDPRNDSDLGQDTVSDSDVSSNSDSYIDFDEMALAAPLNRFVGTIKDKNDPDKAILEAYNVHRFISDVEARIANKRLTSESDKIKEAHLLISSEKGDAKTLVLSPAFECSTFDRFKELCILNWQREEDRDPYHNLVKFKNLKLNGTHSDLIASLSYHGKKIKEDIVNNTAIPKYTDANDDNRTNLIEIDHAIEYFAIGILYENCSEEVRRAFKEWSIDPKAGLIEIHSAIRGLAVKKQTKIEEENVFYVRNKERKQNENKKGKTQIVQNNSKAKKQPSQVSPQPQTQQRQQGYYSHDSYSNQGNYQNYSRGQSNYRSRGRGRGRGRGNYHGYTSGYQSGYSQNNYYNNVVCHKCNRPGHKADTCRSCHYCHGHGHWISDCMIKYNDENKGGGQNNVSNEGNNPEQGQ